jgi:hypothetical protein
MKDFDSNKFQHQINSEFRKIDEFLHEFEHVFELELKKIIHSNFGEIIYFERLKEAISSYANEIISVAESVCDKDLNYPEFRLKEELDNMSHVVEKYPPIDLNSDFMKQSHQKAKELMVNYYPPIFDLSGYGFRLLEKYCQMYNWKFVDIFCSVYKIDAFQLKHKSENI